MFHLGRPRPPGARTKQNSRAGGARRTRKLSSARAVYVGDLCGAPGPQEDKAHTFLPKLHMHMETAILGGLVKEVVMSLGGSAYNEIAKVLGVKGEITKLAERLDSITLELRGCDQNIVARSEATDERLKRLTEIAYEAESIIDRFNIKMGMLHTSRLQEWSGSSLCRCCREVSTRCDTVKRIEKLNKRLQGMTASRELSQVLQALAVRYQPGSSSSIIGPCHDEPNSTGSVISNDCNDHIRRLRRDSGGNQSLFAIVGAPGVGKTSLARKIYQEMRGEFDSRIWVHISSGTGNMTIWFGEDMVRRASSGSEQKEMVRQYLIERRNLLLVIDNVRDKDGWEFLGELGEGFLDRGVRVVLTTSHRDVTRMIGVNRWSGCHHVRALDEDDGWLLLLRTAQLREHEAVGNFQGTGKMIVRMCSGLPLALKAVGSKLRHQDQLRQWTAELSTDFIVFHKEIRRSIDTCYMELGYRLKLCFLYCSLYPEGSVIDQKKIVCQWIAEGFFQGSRDPEEEARGCYTELVNRSLLIPSINSPDCSSTMSNLLRSYAIYRSQDENYVGDPRYIGHAFKVWRLCLADGGTIRDIPDDVKSLRTLLVFGSSRLAQGDDPAAASATLPPPLMNIICRKFTSLRVLDLGDTQIDAVSNSLGRLLQLRYLNLSNTSIRKLPGEVRNLVMLQYLILSNCSCLNSLPRGVGYLKNLRSLDISGTPELRDIRFSLHNLKELNCFGGFLPVSSNSTTSRSSNNGWTFMELSKLSKLTSLQILNLGGSTSSQEAAQLRLHEMSSLKELELCCTNSHLGLGFNRPAGEDAESLLGDVLAELSPPQQLTTLNLVGSNCSELPSWVSSSHLTQLERLTLDGCFQCQQLPSLGEMRDLRFLVIKGFNALSNISDELRGAPSGVAFPRLEQLMLGEMENLQTWSGLGEGDMPLLCSFQLSGCPNLSALPPWLTHCKALTSLNIQRADKLPEIRGLLELKELQIRNCQTLWRISDLSRLQDLEIVSCSSLSMVEGVPLLRSLRLHEHEHEHEMQLPPWLLKPLFRLRTLEIVGAEGLLDKWYSELAQGKPHIQDIADLVHAKLHNGSVYLSYARSTRRFHKSQRCMERANAHGVTLEIPAQPLKETCGDRDHQEAKAWVWHYVYRGLGAVFLVICSALILWSTGTGSSANGIFAG